MPLTKNEKLLVEAIDSMLKQDAKLGLSFHDSDKEQIAERGVEYLHEQIDEMFALRAAELTHAESVCCAFRKVHNYKYLDDPSFRVAMDKEMISTAVPAEERNKALEFVPKIIDELKTEQKEWCERDSGFNPSLDEIREVSKPGQTGKFTIENRPINKRNVEKPENGDGSPAHTSMTQPPLPGDGHDATINPD